MDWNAGIHQSHFRLYLVASHKQCKLCKQHFRFIRNILAEKHRMDFSYFTIDVLSSDEAEIEKVRFAAKFTHLLSFQICNKYRPIQCSDLFFH